MHACFLISHVHTRLSMVSYAFKTPNRARCKIHAVKSNKVRSKLMYASNETPCRVRDFYLPPLGGCRCLEKFQTDGVTVT